MSKMPTQTLSASPFSASELQKMPLFSNQKAAAKSGKARPAATAESSLPEGDLIRAMRTPGKLVEVSVCVDAKPKKLQSSPTQPPESLGIGGTTAFPAQWEPTEEEDQEEEYGELSSYSSTVSQASATSIAPKASGPLFITGDGPHLGFWADVGASTLDLEPVKEDAEEYGFRDTGLGWESDSDEEEEQLLLPWDY